MQDYERVVIFRLGRILGGGARYLLAKVDFCSCSFSSLIQVPRLYSFVQNKINVPRGPGLFFVLPCTDIYEIIDMRVCFSIKLRPLYFMFNLGAKFFGPSPRDDHQGQRYCLRQCHHVLQGEHSTTLTTPHPRKTNLHHPSYR